jgi:hypothetical protein
LRPGPGRWSPAEVIHHLAIVDRRIAERLSGLAEQARSLPPETETSSVLTGPVTRMVLDRTRRFVTSEASEPRETDPATVWEDLLDARDEIESVIAASDGLALGAVSASHPVLGGFTGYDWIAFVGAHAGRHADQIREMMPTLAERAREAASISRADA